MVSARAGEQRLIAVGAGEHISIVSVAIGLALLPGVPIGVVISQHRRTAATVLYVAAIIITIPSIALFGMMIPILSLIGQGIGYLPAVVAILLYSQLPIIRNTHAAITNVDPALREAAFGMGLRLGDCADRLPAVPLSWRCASPGHEHRRHCDAAYIGAGGLGTFIARGIQTDPRQLVTGAVAASVLAVVADFALQRFQHLLTSPGLRT